MYFHVKQIGVIMVSMHLRNNSISHLHQIYQYDRLGLNGTKQSMQMYLEADFEECILCGF